MSRRERIIELSAKIQALRGELSRLEFQLDHLLEMQDEDDQGGQVALFVNHGDGDPSMARQIVALLEMEPEKSFSVNEIVRRLGLPSITSTRATLARLVRDTPYIVRSDRGRFQSTAKMRAMEEEGDVRAIATASLASATVNGAFPHYANGATHHVDEGDDDG